MTNGCLTCGLFFSFVLVSFLLYLSPLALSSPQDRSQMPEAHGSATAGAVAEKLKKLTTGSERRTAQMDGIQSERKN